MRIKSHRLTEFVRPTVNMCTNLNVKHLFCRIKHKILFFVHFYMQFGSLPRTGTSSTQQWVSVWIIELPQHCLELFWWWKGCLGCKGYLVQNITNAMGLERVKFTSLPVRIHSTAGFIICSHSAGFWCCTRCVEIKTCCLVKNQRKEFSGAGQIVRQAIFDGYSAFCAQ